MNSEFRSEQQRNGMLIRAVQNPENGHREDNVRQGVGQPSGCAIDPFLAPLTLGLEQKIGDEMLHQKVNDGEQHRSCFQGQDRHVDGSRI